MKTITGSWLEFQHHNAAEGTYWNPVCFRFTEEQWRQKVREMSTFGTVFFLGMVDISHILVYNKK